MTGVLSRSQVSYFVDSSGLSENNVTTAADLAIMVAVAYKYKKIWEYTTTRTFTVRFRRPRYVLGYTNTNVLVRAGKKDVLLSKTGYLNKSGRCLVMVRQIGRK